MGNEKIYEYGSYEACTTKNSEGKPCPKYKPFQEDWCENCRNEEEAESSYWGGLLEGDPGPDPDDYYGI